MLPIFRAWAIAAMLCAAPVRNLPALGLPYVIKGVRQAMGWEAPGNHRPVPLQVKVEYGALYLLLAAILAAMTYNLHEMLRFARWSMISSQKSCSFCGSCPLESKSPAQGRG